MLTASYLNICISQIITVYIDIINYIYKKYIFAKHIETIRPVFEDPTRIRSERTGRDRTRSISDLLIWAWASSSLSHLLPPTIFRPCAPANPHQTERRKIRTESSSLGAIPTRILAAAAVAAVLLLHHLPRSDGSRRRLGFRRRRRPPPPWNSPSSCGRGGASLLGAPAMRAL